MFEEWELWKELFYLWLTGSLFTISLPTWEAVLGQMIDVPVGDGEVPDLFLPSAHQSSHGVLGEDGALAGQQLRTAEEEEHQQHLQSGVVRETGA